MYQHLHIKDNWLPTPNSINALPKPLRKYIHDLESFSGAELVQENHELSQNLKGAKKLLEIYKNNNNSCPLYTNYKESCEALKQRKKELEAHNAIM